MSKEVAKPEEKLVSKSACKQQPYYANQIFIYFIIVKEKIINRVFFFNRRNQWKQN